MSPKSRWSPVARWRSRFLLLSLLAWGNASRKEKNYLATMYKVNTLSRLRQTTPAVIVHSADGGADVKGRGHQYSLAGMGHRGTGDRGYSERRPGGENTAMAVTEAEVLCSYQHSQ